MNRTTAIGLAGLAVAGGVAAVTYGAEPWNGLVKTDMSSLVATRDVGQSTVIPAPGPTYGGMIEKDASQSTAWWKPAVAPRPGSPNVLLVLIDDEGFAANSTFGGLIPTPVSDQLAREGLRYTNFHTTALCSPTRAALITGRNHGAVGFEMIAEIATGFPGYDAEIGKENATVARILQANGYATAWFGKDHNVPLWEATDAGPKDQWPTGQGFDYFYGFIGGDTDQWHPTIYENTNQIFPDEGHPNYNLNQDLGDKAVAWVHLQSDLKPKQPLFLYYAPGATHAPHQPTPEWIAKMKGKFNMGWDAYREYAFKRQQELGIIPKAAQLTAWPDDKTDQYNGVQLPHWNSLTPYEKKAYAHMMEVYAAYLAQTDYEVGRVVQAFKDTGRYNNTLIFYIHGDNGASAEGGLQGTPSEVWAFNGVFPKVAEFWPKFGSLWGGQYTDPHFPVPWAWALDTPFKWTKQVASYFGGTKNGLIVVWPGHIGDPGGIRTQFHHVIDIVPTILQACNIVEPTEVDGVKQQPIEGVSMTYSFDKANANAPSPHHTQYFEILAAWAIYHDGWVAAVDPSNAPWLVLSNKPIADRWETATWHLYNVAADADWTENTDVAAQYPDKLKEMRALFETEAQRNNVFPIDNSPSFFDARPSLIGDRTTVTYHSGLVALNQADTPLILNSTYTIDGDIVVPPGGANGVIVADGGRFGGYALWLRDGRPAFSYNMIDIATTRWIGQSKLAPGHHVVSFHFDYAGPGFGKGGTGTLSVDGKTVATNKIEHSVPSTLPWFEGLDVGADYSTPVDSMYQSPNKFTGTINAVTFHTTPMQLATQAQRTEYARALYNAAMGIQ
jgi:arylsulfatase A-like enzyme